MRKQTIIKCVECGIKFKKATSEVKRNKKLGRNNFCCLSCASIYGNALKTDIDKSLREFRYLFKRSKRRAKIKKLQFDIDIPYLKTIWDKQLGKCVYSKVQLKLPLSTDITMDHIYHASLDKIDSTKGYIKGNIQFVSISINYMKHTLTHVETLKLIELIKLS